MENPKNLKSRLIKNYIFKGVIFFVASLCAIPLILILITIIEKGVSSIDLHFLTTSKEVPGERVGIWHAIVGSVIMVAIGAVIAIPIGIASGMYLAEKKTRIANYARMSVEILQGIPTIIIGVLVYTWIRSFSGIAGGIALSMVMLPVIVRTTEETLYLVPNAIKEASLALGVPYYKTMLRIIIPSSLSGIVTGIIISLSRIAGETAPLILTAFGNTYFEYNPAHKMNALSLFIFKSAGNPDPEFVKAAWGASFVLLAWIFIMNITAKLLIRRWKVQF